jgi:hypothetical protein
MYPTLTVLWFLGAIGVFAYEFATGTMPFRLLGQNISVGWVLLLLAFYNLARWYSQRTLRQTAQTDDYIHQARLRQAQRRERVDPDPTFDFRNPPTEGDSPHHGDRPPFAN